MLRSYHGACSQDHLDAMFAPDAPPLAWDPQEQYSRDVIELYYLSHAAAPLPVDKLTEVHCWPGKLVSDS